jgi:hypothetical protein
MLNDPVHVVRFFRRTCKRRHLLLGISSEYYAYKDAVKKAMLQNTVHVRNFEMLSKL